MIQAFPLSFGAGEYPAQSARHDSFAVVRKGAAAARRLPGLVGKDFLGQPCSQKRTNRVLYALMFAAVWATKSVVDGHLRPVWDESDGSRAQS